MNEPRLILADEPTGNLDQRSPAGPLAAGRRPLGTLAAALPAWLTARASLADALSYE